MCNLYIETHFFIFFEVYIFYREKTKNRCKTASGKKGRKTRPDDPPETRFGTQNSLKSTSEASKSPKFPGKKNDFLTVRFLTVFSSTEKTENIENKRPTCGSWFGTTVRAEPGGEVRRGKLSGRPVRSPLECNTPAPRRGTANLIRSARSPYPRETPQSEFRRLAVYPGNIPAEPDKPRQDPDGTGKQNLAKSLQNLVREGPRSLQNQSGTLPEHTRAKKPPTNRKRKLQK